MIYNNVLEALGETPMIRLNHLGDKDGAEHDLSEWEKALAESDLSEEAVTEELKNLQEVRESL